MLGMEAVAERMADLFVGQHTMMPRLGKASQAVHAARRLKDSLHCFIMPIVPGLLQLSKPGVSKPGVALVLVGSGSFNWLMVSRYLREFVYGTSDGQNTQVVSSALLPA